MSFTVFQQIKMTRHWKQKIFTWSEKMSAKILAYKRGDLSFFFSFQRCEDWWCLRKNTSCIHRISPISPTQETTSNCSLLVQCILSVAMFFIHKTLDSERLLTVHLAKISDYMLQWKMTETSFTCSSSCFSTSLFQHTAAVIHLSVERMNINSKLSFSNIWLSFWEVTVSFILTSGQSSHSKPALLTQRADEIK